MLFSCSLFEKVKFIYPSGEITDVHALSDTSVMVSIDVYGESSANWCEIYISVDPDSVASGHTFRGWAASGCDPDPHYNAVIAGLKKGKRYYFRLFGGGSYDLGGPNQTSYNMLGEVHPYTLP